MNRKFEDIDLSDLLFILKKYFILIISITILFGIAGKLYSKKCIVQQFQAQAQILVNIPLTHSDYINMYDATLMNQTEINTYAVVLKSGDMLDKIIKNLNLKKSKSELSNEITVASVKTTEVLEIKVVDKSAQTAKAIAEELLKYAPLQITRVIKTGSVEVIAQPEVVKAPVASYKRYLVPIAAFGGFVLSFLGALFAELLNPKFKNTEEVKKLLGMDIIGVIPYSENRRGEIK